MKKNREFDTSESRLTYLINQLKNNLNNNEDLNRTYNRLLIERASIRKKLEYKKSNNVLTSFCQKLNRKNQKNLICDYFKSKTC
jgi:hypothetical protein